MEKPVLNKEAKMGLLITIAVIVFWLVMFINWWVFTLVTIVTGITLHYWIMKDDLRTKYVEKSNYKPSEEEIRAVVLIGSAIIILYAPAIIFEILRDKF